MRVVQLWVRKARAAVGMVVMLRLFLLLPLGGVAFLLPYTTSLSLIHIRSLDRSVSPTQVLGDQTSHEQGDTWLTVESGGMH